VSRVPSILFGAAFTIAVAWAIGRLLFHRLRISLFSFEHDLLAGATGAAILSFTVFLLCAVNAARAPVFLLIGLGAIALSVRFGAVRGARLPALPPFWRILFVVIFGFYACVYLSNSLAPEVSPDGQTYHLGLVYRFLREHGFHRLTTNLYSGMPLGFEMLFLLAFSVGRNAAAATVHCCFLLALPLLILSYARRMGHPRAGVCAALIAGLAPVMGVDGVSAYNDVALATTAFSMFYLLEIWSGEQAEQNDALLIPVGLLAGFCMAIKLTGFVAPLYAALVILMRRRPRALLPVAAAASLLVLPWLIKDWIWLGNPVSPFFNRLFPNPWVHVSWEDFTRAWFAHDKLTSARSWFPAVTVGGQLGGQTGPIYLLSPLALLALRSPIGRRCLLAAACFLVPYPLNIGARFLAPALPFIALSLALALEFLPAILAILALAAALLAWPRVVDKYDAQYGGWHIEHVPWQAALHIVPQQKFLDQWSPPWRLAQLLNRYVPPGGHVWSTISVGEAYATADVMLRYQSAEGELIDDVLTAAARGDSGLNSNLRFRIPPTRVQHLRFAQTAASPDEIWSIEEARFFDGPNEIVRTSAWRFDAKPFPWQIGLAFDGNPATRWRSWESIHPGMHVDVDFGEPVTMDRLELHSGDDQGKAHIQPQVCDAGCVAIAATLENLMDAAPAGELRQRAVQFAKERGIDYLLVDRGYPLATGMQQDPARWGMEFIAEQESNRLYKIQ